MKITRDNYEAFLLDKLEGNLTTSDAEALALFLLQNPDIELVDDLPSIKGNTEFGFEQKDRLKKTLPPSGFSLNQIDDLLIAKLEGDLSAAQEKLVNQQIANNEKIAASWALLQATVVTSTAIFTAKPTLKKGGIIIPLFGRLAIAASIALLFGIFWFTSPNASSDPLVKIEEQNNPSNSEVIEEHATQNTALAEKSTEEPPRNVSTKTLPTNNVVKATIEIPLNQAPKDFAGSEIERESIQKITSKSSRVKRTLPEAKPINTTPALPVFAAIPALNTTNAPNNVESYTVSELMASVVRKNVLQTESPSPKALGKEDAVAMVDRSLQVLSHGNAGFHSQSTKGRRRLELRIGGVDFKASLSD